MTWKRLWKEWILPFGLEILALLLIVKFIFFIAIVPSGSMEPTIQERSALFTLRVHDLEKLERGDVIVFEAETPELAGTTLIKRLIGLPGDHVEIDENGIMTINGEVQSEDYVVYQYAIPSVFDVPEGYYLFMGDNRANSLDSRYWSDPYVSAESIQGRAVFTLFPFSHFGKLR
ncbi:MAG: signal peptidase I [Angelakisella sp.]|nr:signal peptidase I [Angelakisella sp.]